MLAAVQGCAEQCNADVSNWEVWALKMVLKLLRHVQLVATTNQLFTQKALTAVSSQTLRDIRVVCGRESFALGRDRAYNFNGAM